MRLTVNGEVLNTKFDVSALIAIKSLMRKNSSKVRPNYYLSLATLHLVLCRLM